MYPYLYLFRHPIVTLDNLFAVFIAIYVFALVVTTSSRLSPKTSFFFPNSAGYPTWHRLGIVLSFGSSTNYVLLLDVQVVGR